MGKTNPEILEKRKSQVHSAMAGIDEAPIPVMKMGSMFFSLLTYLNNLGNGDAAAAMRPSNAHKSMQFARCSHGRYFEGRGKYHTSFDMYDANSCQKRLLRNTNQQGSIDRDEDASREKKEIGLK